MIKVSIIGVGHVGSSVAYDLLQSGITNDVVIIDKDKKKIAAEVLDISHALSNFDFTLREGDYKDISDRLVIITAGEGRKFNETRNDLVHQNYEIIKGIVSKIKPFYNDNIIVVVSNPVEIMTYCVSKLLNARDGKVIGTGTSLDSVRLKYELSKLFNKPKSSIDCTVIGEHGDKSIPLRKSIKIDGKNISDNFDLKQVMENVHTSSDKILEGKGFTSYGISNVVVELIKNIVTDSNKVLPLSTILNGDLGFSDVCMSLPGVVTSQGIKNKVVCEMTKQEVDLFKCSVQRIKKLISDIFEKEEFEDE